MESEQKPKEVEVDDKGVPFENRLREMERKLQEKLDKELSDARREIETLKTSKVVEEESPAPAQPYRNQEDAVKAELLEFVKNPKGFIQAANNEVEFQRQLPQAESWLRNQKGYTSKDDTRIFQIIKENHLDTPYHSPMERANTAWKLLNAEKYAQSQSADNDNQNREASILKTSTETSGKVVEKKNQPTRSELVDKLAQAEARGDLAASTAIMDLLDDAR